MQELVQRRAQTKTVEQVIDMPQIEGGERSVEVPQEQEVQRYVEAPQIQHVEKMEDVSKSTTVLPARAPLSGCPLTSPPSHHLPLLTQRKSRRHSPVSAYPDDVGVHKTPSGPLFRTETGTETSSQGPAAAGGVKVSWELDLELTVHPFAQFFTQQDKHTTL